MNSHVKNELGAYDDVRALGLDGLNWHDLSWQLKQAIEWCAFSAHWNSVIHGALAGVFVKGNRVWSYDIGRASRYILPENVEEDFLIEASFLKHLKEYKAGKFGRYELNSYAVSDGRMHFKGEDIRVSFPLFAMDHDFVDYPEEFMVFPVAEADSMFQHQIADQAPMKLTSGSRSVLKALTHRTEDEQDSVKLEFSQNKLACSIARYSPAPLSLENGPEEPFTIYVDAAVLKDAFEHQAFKNRGDITYLRNNQTLVFLANSFMHAIRVREHPK
jgi:hypothetical protein